MLGFVKVFKLSPETGKKCSMSVPSADDIFASSVGDSGDVTVEMMDYQFINKSNNIKVTILFSVPKSGDYCLVLAVGYIKSFFNLNLNNCNYDFLIFLSSQHDST